MSRYVLTELMKVFVLTLSCMTVVLILAGVAQEAIREGLGAGPVLQLLPFALPNALRFAVPGTMLFAVCSVYGRMSAAGEITAVKAAGLSPLAMVWPALIFAFVMSLLTVWLNDLAVSWGREGVKRVVLESVEQIAYGMLRTHRAYNSDDFSLTVQRVEGHKLIEPVIIVAGSGSSPQVTLTAREAELHCEPERGVLVFVMRDGAADRGGDGKLAFQDTFTHEVALSNCGGPHSSERASHCPMRRIPAAVAATGADLVQREHTLALQAAGSLLDGGFDELSAASYQQEQTEVESSRMRLHRLHTEPWRRWANGFSCFFFVLVGAPLAIRMRTSDFWTTFGLCILPILLVYYPLLAFGVDRAKCGEAPPYSVWLGNVMLAGGGYALLQSVRRH